MDQIGEDKGGGKTFDLVCVLVKHSRGVNSETPRPLSVPPGPRDPVHSCSGPSLDSWTCLPGLRWRLRSFRPCEDTSEPRPHCWIRHVIGHRVESPSTFRISPTCRTHRPHCTPLPCVHRTPVGEPPLKRACALCLPPGTTAYCYGLDWGLPKRCSAVLTRRPRECDFIWNWGPRRCHRVKRTSSRLRRALNMTCLGCW